jgi:hypothetical protein
MADRSVAPAEPSLHRDDSPLSTAAIISYAILALFLIVILCVFSIVWNHIPVEPVLLTTIGGLITATVGGVSAVAGFWLASSAGAKANSAAIRQLAGAGAPPPADPETGVKPEKAAK